MKLFGSKRDKHADARDPEVKRRETVENAREAQYLQRLSSSVEKGVPLHRSNKGIKSQPQSASTFPNNGGVKPLAQAGRSKDDPFVNLPGKQASKGGEYSFGDIIELRDGTIGVYNRFIAEKDYDVVYTLQPTGDLKPQGIPLAAHGAETIGRLPNAHTKQICSEKTWDRDLIIYHLYEFDFTKRIPVPQAAAPRAFVDLSDDLEEEVEQPRSAPPEPKKTKPIHHACDTPESEHRTPLIRGRKFSVKFGDREWEAVYWGHDDQGALVAHHTSGEWNLMHLDLSRFENSIKYSDLVVGDELIELEQALLSAGSQSEST